MTSAIYTEPIVSLGSHVHIRDVESGEREVYTVVRPNDADIRHSRISTLSPIGRALYGRRPGHVVEVQAPGGVFQVEIEKIEPADEPKYARWITHWNYIRHTEAKVFTASESADRINPQAVERAARANLAGTGYSTLRTVECSYRDGRMILRGKVPSYYHKQIAQEVLRNATHVNHVVNNLEVVAR